MLDCIVDCFLSDEIEVRRGMVVRDCNRLGAVELAGCLSFLLGPVGQVGQRSHEPFGINRNGKQALKGGSKLTLAATQALDHLLE